jgi:uncharacterized protein
MPRIFTALDHFLYALPGLIVTVWAQIRIWQAQAAGSRSQCALGITGAEAAVAVMKAANVEQVAIEPAEGELCNHYDAAHKVLRLSPRVCAGMSPASIGIAAHEAGHAIQHAKRYPGLLLRNAIVPLASIGSTACWLPLLAGIAFGLTRLVDLGISLFLVAVVLQVLNLPVEFDSSRRGRAMLRSTGLISPEEEPVVSKVLNAAALTYVAAALTGISTLFFYFKGSSSTRSSHRVPGR